jgi:hypothetical protein
MNFWGINNVLLSHLIVRAKILFLFIIISFIFMKSFYMHFLLLLWYSNNIHMWKDAGFFGSSRVRQGFKNCFVDGCSCDHLHLNGLFWVLMRRSANFYTILMSKMLPYSSKNGNYVKVTFFNVWKWFLTTSALTTSWKYTFFRNKVNISTYTRKSTNFT